MYKRYVKRMLDFVFTLILLIIVSPLILLTVIAIKTDTKGSVFFIQNRVGLNGRIFKLYKLRTMEEDKEAEKFFDFSKDVDRITKVGKILRRFKIDELPQLINVLIGDMSLVGPRPTVKIQVDKYSVYEKQRLEVRPGMTGLAQVNGNITLPWDERIKYDIYYVHNHSLLLDIMIIIKTIAIILFGEDKFKKKITQNKV